MIIDVESVSQVARMLVGGMKVVGIYLWVSNDAFKNSTIILSQVVYFFHSTAFRYSVLIY